MRVYMNKNKKMQNVMDVCRIEPKERKMSENGEDALFISKRKRWVENVQQ